MIVKFTDAEHACSFNMGESLLHHFSGVSDFTVEYTCPVCDAVWEYSYHREGSKWNETRNCVKRSSPSWVKSMITLLDKQPGQHLNRRQP